MKLYQTNDGCIIADQNIKEIGAIADGWKFADRSARPKDHAVVDVVLRNGIRHENFAASNFNWNLDGTKGDIVAFRVVPININIQLEVGGIYKTRSGAIHGPLRAFADDTYSFGDEVRTWTPSGIYYVGDSPTPDDPLNLVEKIAVVPTDTASEWVTWGKSGEPNIPKDSLVEIATINGVVWTGIGAQRPDFWVWSSKIVAYRVLPPPAKPTLSLEVGGIYRTRDGNICGPLSAVVGGGDLYPFTDATWSWMVDGGYYRGQLSHPRDLVERIAVVPADTASEWVAWNQPHKPNLPTSTIVEIVTRSGVVRAGPDHAQRIDQWFWDAAFGSQPYPILAYRVVPALPLSIEERVARLEARFS
jgi:hypothetical protein